MFFALEKRMLCLCFSHCFICDIHTLYLLPAFHLFIFYFQANPPQYDRAEDLASLRHLNEAACLHTLRQRFGSNLIHTYGGPNLLVVNPREELGIYNDKVSKIYHSDLFMGNK